MVKKLYFRGSVQTVARAMGFAILVVSISFATLASPYGYAEEPAVAMSEDEQKDAVHALYADIVILADMLETISDSSMSRACFEMGASAVLLRGNLRSHKRLLSESLGEDASLFGGRLDYVGNKCNPSPVIDFQMSAAALIEELLVEYVSLYMQLQSSDKDAMQKLVEHLKRYSYSIATDEGRQLLNSR